jgi:DNA-binding LacI/PurR family transcriptional regulator
MARFANPPLTTVYQNTLRAGELLVEALLRQIRDEPVESQMIPASLMVRRSSGTVPADTAEFIEED